jgi:diacylglycerol kinase (ATP)
MRQPCMTKPTRPSTAPRFTVVGRVKSFHYAFAGLWLMLRTQHNAWLHLSATVAVLAAGLALGVRPADWRWLIAALAVVWTAEAMNTAFEHLCDVVSPEFHAGVQRCKDIAAGAVLICAIAAAVLGAITFWPYVFG